MIVPSSVTCFILPGIIDVVEGFPLSPAGPPLVTLSHTSPWAAAGSAIATSIAPHANARVSFCMPESFRA
jgi:hypothetical protein